MTLVKRKTPPLNVLKNPFPPAVVQIAIYARVSTEEQAEQGYSIEAQLETLRALCKTEHKIVFKEYIDAGISGKTIDKRPALKELLRDVESGQIQMQPFTHKMCLIFVREVEDQLKTRDNVAEPNNCVSHQGASTLLSQSVETTLFRRRMRTMTLKKRKPIATLLVVLAALTLLAVPAANASPVNPHWYAAQRLSVTTTGIYSSITNDQEDLDHVSGSFINKEMWIGFSNTRWIEAGTTRGPVNNSDGYVDDWHGHFIAYQTATGDYHERNVETEYKTGTHNFQISRDTINGSTNWTIYFDYNRVATIPAITNTSGVSHDVGIVYLCQ